MSTLSAPEAASTLTNTLMREASKGTHRQLGVIVEYKQAAMMKLHLNFYFSPFSFRIHWTFGTGPVDTSASPSSDLLSYISVADASSLSIGYTGKEEGVLAATNDRVSASNEVNSDAASFMNFNEYSADMKFVAASSALTLLVLSSLLGLTIRCAFCSDTGVRVDFWITILVPSFLLQSFKNLWRKRLYYVQESTTPRKPATKTRRVCSYEEQPYGRIYAPKRF